MSYASMPSFSFILFTVSEKKNFDFFLWKFTLYVAPQPIKLSDLDKSRMKRGRLLNKHFCKKIFKYPKWLGRYCQFPLFPL